MKFLVFVFVLIVSFSAHAFDWGKIKPCYDGDIDVRSIDDLQLLQSQRCIRGDVFIDGLFIVGDEVFEELDLGRVRSIFGALVVTNNPRLKFVVSDLKRVGFVNLSANPMLAECRAELFALRAGAHRLWAGYLLPQTCGLMQWEREELEALREYYGIY